MNSRHQLPQHIGQNAAMLVVVDLDRRVDAANHWNGLGLAGGACEAQREILLRFQTGCQAKHVVALGPIELERQSVGAFLKLEWQHAHTDQVRSMDSFETLRYHSPDSEQSGSFCGPVT